MWFCQPTLSEAMKIICLFLLCLTASVAAQEICTVKGNDGPCQMNVFLPGNAANCKPFMKASYEGQCKNGKLEGVNLVKRPPTQADEIGWTWHLGIFRSGTILRPHLSYAHQIIGVDFETDKGQASTGCINFASKWDGLDYWPCVEAAKIFGAEMLSKSVWQQVRSDKFTESSMRTLQEKVSSQPSAASAQSRDDTAGGEPTFGERLPKRRSR